MYLEQGGVKFFEKTR